MFWVILRSKTTQNTIKKGSGGIFDAPAAFFLASRKVIYSNEKYGSSFFQSSSLKPAFTFFTLAKSA